MAFSFKRPYDFKAIKSQNYLLQLSKLSALGVVPFKLIANSGARCLYFTSGGALLTSCHW